MTKRMRHNKPLNVRIW